MIINFEALIQNVHRDDLTLIYQTHKCWRGANDIPGLPFDDEIKDTKFQRMKNPTFQGLNVLKCQTGDVFNRFDRKMNSGGRIDRLGTSFEDKSIYANDKSSPTKVRTTSFVSLIPSAPSRFTDKRGAENLIPKNEAPKHRPRACFIRSFNYKFQSFQER